MSSTGNLLNLHQSLKLTGISKLSRAQLKVSLANNRELQILNERLSKDLREVNKNLSEQNRNQSEALLVQKKILENQIAEKVRKETINFHRERLVKCKEYLKDFHNLKDDAVISFYIRVFAVQLEEIICESKDVFEEISDKEYALNLQSQLKSIREKGSTESSENLTSSIFELDYRIEQYYQEYRTLEILKIETSTAKKDLQSAVISYKAQTNTAVNKEKRRSKGLLIGALVIVILAVLKLLDDISKSSFLMGNYLVSILIIVILMLLWFVSQRKIKETLRKFEIPFESELEYKKGNLAAIEIGSKKLVDLIEKLKIERVTLLKKLFKHHPDFKIISYVFE